MAGFFGGFNLPTYLCSIVAISWILKTILGKWQIKNAQTIPPNTMAKCSSKVRLLGLLLSSPLFIWLSTMARPLFLLNVTCEFGRWSVTILLETMDILMAPLLLSFTLELWCLRRACLLVRRNWKKNLQKLVPNCSLIFQIQIYKNFTIVKTLVSNINMQ